MHCWTNVAISLYMVEQCKFPRATLLKFQLEDNPEHRELQRRFAIIVPCLRAGCTVARCWFLTAHDR